MIARLLARLRSLWRGLRHSPDVDAEMADEFRAHVEMRAEDLERTHGLSREAALRKARVEFGSQAEHRDEGRASRGLRWFDDLRISWLDVKLGFRMLRKYPGLTVTAGLAMAFAIGVGAATFEMVTQVIAPRLPLDEGDRVVSVDAVFARDGRIELQTVADFSMWRNEMDTVDDLGAYRESFQPLLEGQGSVDPVLVAETTASAFTVARVPALLGRALILADEEPGAPPVVVIGYDVWRTRFAEDSTLVGRTVTLGGVPRTVVGVMPDGFGFPVAHEAWVPLAVSALSMDPARSPEVTMFGRLARGATIETADAELGTLGLRAAAASTASASESTGPLTGERVFRGPSVTRYAMGIDAIVSGMSSGMAVVAAVSTNLLPLALLGLICANVALLVFARTAARESEIVVRTALGATRRRILTQLFTEALVLGVIASVVGLALAGFGVGWAFDRVGQEILDGYPLPFWFRGRLSIPTIIYAASLGILASVIAGVVPGLKVTGVIGSRLREASAGGGGLRLGGAWTAVIVVQVAFSVVAPTLTLAMIREVREEVSPEIAFAAEEYVGASLDMERILAGLPDDAGEAERLAAIGSVRSELERRLVLDPAVSGVTFTRQLPLQYHPWNLIEVDGGAIAPPDERGHRVGVNTIEPDFFEVLGVSLPAGREFNLADVESESRVAIVDQPFVAQVLGGASPLGRHVRIVANEADREPRFDRPWYEIVGVAPTLGARSRYGPAGIYLPSGPAPAYPAHVVVHVRGDPGTFGRRLLQIANDVDPALTLRDIATLDQTTAQEEQFYAFWIRIAATMSALALALSLAGIYSAFAFTVSRKTREIGVRIALGADSRRVTAGVFARPLLHVVIGTLVGATLTWGLRTRGIFTISSAVALLAYAALMLGICLLACVVPVRRALGIQPIEALKTEA